MTTISRPGLTLEQTANSFHDIELEGMASGNNPVANAYRELLAHRQAAKRAAAMEELLRDLRDGAVTHLHNCTVCKNEDGVANWTGKLQRIDALLSAATTPSGVEA